MTVKWYARKSHSAWHIAAVALGVLVGSASAPGFGYSFADGTWLIVATPILVTVFVSRRNYLFLAALVAGGLIGLYRGSAVGQAIADYSEFYGTQVVLSGRVNEDTSYGPKGEQRMRIDRVSVDGTQLTATVWISYKDNVDIKRGDLVRVSGVLSEGFGNTPATMYRAQVNSVERPIPGDIGRRVRDWFGSGVHAVMPVADADFALAFLLGQKLSVSDDLNDKLRTVGLIHAVVASGYHLTVLVGVVRRLFVKVSKYLTLLLSGGMIGGFILITGFSPSMTRAGLVTGLSLLAWYYGRLIHPVVLLLFTAALTVLYKPQYVWGDVGWLLSFAAFSGVIILAPLLHRYFWGTKKPSIIREVLVATFAAQLVTLPITIYVFGYYSAYALLANLLVIPLIPFIMLATFMTGVLGLIFIPAGILFGWLTSLMLRYVTFIVDWIFNLPHSRTDTQLSLFYVCVSYVVIALVVGFLWYKTKLNFRRNRDVYKLF